MEGTKRIYITLFNATSFHKKEDVLIEETPLQILLVHGPEHERKNRNSFGNYAHTWRR